MIKYGYIEGDHEPNRLRQFSGAVCDLSKMHTVGFMHGDTKLKNIVFQKDTSHLIDYDLASEERSNYPAGYNHHFKQWHKKLCQDRQCVNSMTDTHCYSG